MKWTRQTLSKEAEGQDEVVHNRLSGRCRSTAKRHRILTRTAGRSRKEWAAYLWQCETELVMAQQDCSYVAICLLVH